VTSHRFGYVAVGAPAADDANILLAGPQCLQHIEATNDFPMPARCMKEGISYEDNHSTDRLLMLLNRIAESPPPTVAFKGGGVATTGETQAACHKQTAWRAV